MATICSRKRITACRTAALGDSFVDITPVTAHEVTLSGLTPATVYYYTVGEFRDLAPRETGGFRINGKVEAGSIERRSAGLDVRFVMTDGEATLPVEYHGVVPDTFVDGADVVVEGGLREDGTFVATNLLAKCPSKYEAARDRGERVPHRDGRARGV